MVITHVWTWNLFGAMQPGTQATSQHSVQAPTGERTPVAPPQRKRVRSIEPTQSAQKTIVPTPNICRFCIGLLKAAQSEPSKQQHNINIFQETICNWRRRIPEHFFSVNWKAPNGQIHVDYSADFKIKLKIALMYQCLLSLANYNKKSFEPSEIVLPTLEEHGNITTISVFIDPYTISFNIDKTKNSFTLDTTINPNSSASIAPYVSHFFKDSFRQLFNQARLTDAADRFKRILSYIPQNLRVDEKDKPFKEKFYQTLFIGTLTFMGSCLTIPELYTGNGRSDIIIMSDEGNSIVELKYGKYGNAQEALNQIEEKNYQNWFGGTSQHIKAVGINISQEHGQFSVTCYEKQLTFKPPKITSTDNHWQIIDVL